MSFVFILECYGGATQYRHWQHGSVTLHSFARPGCCSWVGLGRIQLHPIPSYYIHYPLQYHHVSPFWNFSNSWALPPLENYPLFLWLESFVCARLGKDTVVLPRVSRGTHSFSMARSKVRSHLGTPNTLEVPVTWNLPASPLLKLQDFYRAHKLSSTG